MSEKSSSGTKNSKQTNKTKIDEINIYLKAEVILWHLARIMKHESVYLDQNILSIGEILVSVCTNISPKCLPDISYIYMHVMQNKTSSTPILIWVSVLVVKCKFDKF